MAQTIVKTETLATSPASTIPDSQPGQGPSVPPSLANTYVGPEAHNAPPVRNWSPPTLNQSFIRSEAPPPSAVRLSAPTGPSVRTADESEPVFMQMLNRDMAENSPNNQQPAPAQGDSFFDGSFRDIGAKLKACNDTLGELQQLGVSHIVSLPRLVLVGDQSAGKSSLMSGLAGLNLPRSEGVCTRCPIHIRVSRHHEWSCRVSLQLDYAFAPPESGQITKADVTDDNPFPPWMRQNRVVKEFMTIYDSGKEDLETVLRWAQVAILNHDQSSDLFIPGRGAFARSRDLAEAAEDTAAKFSPNTVALEIKGPDLPDLSFYDLPGIFRNAAQEEDEYLVEVVERLAREHMKQNDALIIWAVPMNADPETSSTLSIIRDIGAQRRTIGVMTKADLLPLQGNHGQWLSMLRGDRHRIGHEYFITSRPTDEALEVQARWEEALFSDNGHDKWPLEFLEFRGRCGVERLKAALSEKLGKEFATNLPSIKHKVQVTLREVHKHLANLPELPANVELEVRRSLMEFSDIAKTKLRGHEFSSSFSQLAEKYRQCLLHTKPKFTMKDASDTTTVEISDDEDNISSAPSSRKRAAQPNGTPTSKRPRHALVNGTQTPHRSPSGVKVEEGRLRNGSPFPQTPTRRGPYLLPAPFEQYTDKGRRFRTIGEIREDIRAKTRAGMPDVVPDEVYRGLCKQAIKHWDGPMQTFLEETMALVNRIVKAAFEDAFQKLKRRLIFSQSKAHMREFLQDRRTSALGFLEDLYKMETFQLFTLNNDSFKEYREQERHLLERYRHYQRYRAFVGEVGDLNFPDWARMTSDQRAEEVRRHNNELAKMGADPFKTEVEVAAYVRGYYKLAALRFADTTALSVTARMLPGIINLLDCSLEEKLGIMGEGAFAACQHLMDEDDQTAKRRDDLKATADKLRKAEDSIRDLEVEAGDAANKSATADFYRPLDRDGLGPETLADDCGEEV